VAGPGVIVVCALAGLVAGWFAVVPVIEALPDPAPLSRWQRHTVVLLTGALWGWIGGRLEAAPRFRAASITAEVHASPHGWGYVVPTLLLAAVLVAVSVIDLRTFRIPDRITFPALAASLVAITAGGAQALGGHDGFVHARNALVGMALYFGFLFIPHLVSPRGMGFGDVKLAGVLGGYLGWLGWGEIVVGGFTAFLLGGVIGIALLAVRRAGRKSAIPFGPWMVLGALVAVLWGSALADLYLDSLAG